MLTGGDGGGLNVAGERGQGNSRDPGLVVNPGENGIWISKKLWCSHND